MKGNNKTDHRVKYTKMIIRQSLLELMKERPVTKITVTDICEKAEINRGTFYTHYSDQYDLLSQIQNELYNNMKQVIDRLSKSVTISGLVMEIFHATANNNDMCMILFSKMDDREFLGRIMYIAHDKILESWRKSSSKKIDTAKLELMYSFCANGGIGVIQDWVQNGTKESMEEIAQIMEGLTKQGLSAFLDKY